jgi:hypothetical protein
VVGKSKSQAFFLTFCTFMGLISLALVLSIQFQDIGEKWFYITLLSPYAYVLPSLPHSLPPPSLPLSLLSPPSALGHLSSSGDSIIGD